MDVKTRPCWFGDSITPPSSSVFPLVCYKWTSPSTTSASSHPPPAHFFLPAQHTGHRRQRQIHRDDGARRRGDRDGRRFEPGSEALRLQGRAAEQGRRASAGHGRLHPPPRGGAGQDRDVQAGAPALRAPPRRRDRCDEGGSGEGCGGGGGGRRRRGQEQVDEHGAALDGRFRPGGRGTREARQGEGLAGGQVPRRRRRSLAAEGWRGLRRAGVRAALPENGRQGRARRDARPVHAVAAGGQERRRRRRGGPAPGGGVCAGGDEGGRRHGASCPCAWRWPPVPIAAAAGKEGSALLVHGAAPPVRRRLESARWPPGCHAKADQGADEGGRPDKRRSEKPSSEIPAAQPEGAGVRRGEPAAHRAGGRAVDSAGAEQLAVRVSPRPAPLLHHLRDRRLVGGHRQLRGGRRPVRELRLEMMERLLLACCIIREEGRFWHGGSIATNCSFRNQESGGGIESSVAVCLYTYIVTYRE